MRISIAGDFTPYHRIPRLAAEGKHEAVMGQVSKSNQAFDYCIVNLECPIVTGEAQPIQKVGPNLKGDHHAVALLKAGGFHCVTLANNHVFDYGDEGIASTLRTLHEYGIDHVGGGTDLAAASQTLYKQFHGETVAIINCTEHEFSIATPHSGGANPIDPISQYYAIQEARGKADYVLVIVHGGIEYYDIPTPRMQATYRFFVDAGADAVVNHHQHRFSGYEVYHGHPIFYGLGNFCFDWPNLLHGGWNLGYMVGLTLDKSGVTFQLMPYHQCGETPDIHFLEGEDRQPIDERMKEINAVIADPHQMIESHQAFIARRSIGIRQLLSPYTSKTARTLCAKGLLPSLYPDKKIPLLLNQIECESHRERLIWELKERLHH